MIQLSDSFKNWLTCGNIIQTAINIHWQTICKWADEIIRNRGNIRLILNKASLSQWQAKTAKVLIFFRHLKRILEKTELLNKNQLLSRSWNFIWPRNQMSEFPVQQKKLCISKYKVIEKSCNPFLTHVLFVKKYITLKSENKKRCYFECWKCPPNSAMHAFTLFLMFDAAWWRVSAVTCVTEMVHQTRYCRFVWHRRIGKCIPKLILAS
jgi:hypothetical protein